MKGNSIRVLFTIAVCLSLFFPACSKSEKTGKNSRENIEFTDVSQLNKSEYTIGYAEGQSSAMLLRKVLPKAQTRSFFELVTGYEAVKQGKITAFAFDKVQTELAIKNGLKGVKILGNLGEPIQTAVGISPVSKIPDLEEKINEFITECRKSGLLADMLQRWTSFTSDTIPEIKPVENPKYNLVIGTTGIVPPYSYHKGTELSGFDIELAMRFASWLGASYTFKVYDYGAIIAAAVTGDIDCIMANLNVTKERKERISFSMPISSDQNIIVVRDDGSAAGQNSSPAADDKTFNSFSDLNKKGVTIGMGTGTNFVSLCEKAFPNATLQYYNTYSDMAALILKDKLSAMVLDSPSAAELQKEVKGLKQLDEFLGKNDYAIGFPKTEKGAALRDQIDEFIEKKEKDGSLKKLQEVWFGQDESIKKIQPLPASSPKGTIRMVTDSLTPPFSYIKEGRTAGYDIALVSEFCLEYGYALSITSLDFSAILPALHTSSCDIAAGGMAITPERSESIYFSRPLYEGKTVVLVKDGGKPESPSGDEKITAEGSGTVPEQFKNVTLKYNSISEMDKDGLVLGMHTGFVMVDKLTRQMLPKAKIEYYKTTSDMAYLVSSGKIDGFVNDEPIIRYVSLEIPDLGYIDFDGKSLPMVACFPKNEKGRLLRDEFNSYIKKWKNDGRLKAIDDLWLSKDEEKKVVDLGHFDAKKGVIRLGTTADTPPFEYMKDGKIVGYEIDLVARFCREAGYGLEIQDVPFDSLIMGLQSGMYDMVASCLSDTPAHRESTNISEPIYDSRLVMAVQILDREKGAQDEDDHGKSIANSEAGLRYHSFDELNIKGKKIGVQTGSSFDKMADTFFPTAEVQYFNSTTDMAKLVAMGKLDAMIADEPAAQSLTASIKNIGYIHDYLEPANFSAAFQKNKDGEKLRDEMNAFLTKAMSDGSLKKLQQIWFGNDESKKVVDYSSLPATNGTLKLATSAEYPPFEYLQNNKIVGYDIACAAAFCKEYGYALKIFDMNFDAILSALVSKACDFAIAGISVTEERSKSVNFSIPTYDGGVVVIVQKNLEKNTPKTKYVSEDEVKTPGKKRGVQTGAVTNLIESLAVSFEKTFVREGRWRLVLHGTGITIIISIFSALFGTLLGFIICGLRLSKNRIADGAALVFIRTMQGLPMVVFLMILYYLVFAKSGLSGVWVAVIGFGMNFSAYVSEMIRTGILAVDKGQMEAALALGYPKAKAFLKMILPQAARHFLPVYQGEFISLVKMTSVVGYIAIQDLTKAGDIIRSRTYEAFFPLITTAIIYFIIAWLLTRVLTVLQAQLEPKKMRTK